MTTIEKIEQERKLEPFIEKLRIYCLDKLRVVILTDILGVNVQLIGEKKHVQIAHEIFLRWNGIACIHKEQQQKNFIEIVPVTDEMFYMQYMRAIIDKHFV